MGKYNIIVIIYLLFFIYGLLSTKSPGFPNVTPRIEDISIFANQSSGCGGVLEAYRGFISYKLNENYDNNEKCIWTIKSTRAVILFALLNDGFEPQYDFLTIYNLDKFGVLVSSGRLTHGYKELSESFGSTVFLTFTSDRTTTGKGFLLEYIGFGPLDLINVGELGHTHLYSNSESGNQVFPEKRSMHPGGYALFSYVVNPSNVNDEGKTQTLSFTVDSLDMASFYSGCNSNYFSIHQLFADSFDLRLRNCEPNKLKSSTVTSSSPLLVTFFGYLNPDRSGFQIHWESIVEVNTKSKDDDESKYIRSPITSDFVENYYKNSRRLDSVRNKIVI